MKALIRPGMVVAAFIIGYFLPCLHEWSFLIRYLIMTMLYIVALQLRIEHLAFKKSHFLILGANFAIGIGGYLLLRALKCPELAKAAFFTGITPTATAAAVVMGFLGGSVGFVITGFALTNVVVSCSLFFLIPLVAGNLSADFFGQVAQNILLVIGLPFLLGAVTRKCYRGSELLARKLKDFSFTLWAVTLVIIAAGASHFIATRRDVSKLVIFEILGITLVLCVTNFVTGYFLGGRRYRRESSQTLGQKNTTFTIYLALSCADALTAMGPTCYVLWHNLWNALQLYLHDHKSAARKRRADKAPAVSAPEARCKRP